MVVCLCMMSILSSSNSVNNYMNKYNVLSMSKIYVFDMFEAYTYLIYTYKVFISGLSGVVIQLPPPSN